MEKPNRTELRQLMGSYDVSADQVAPLIGKSSATIHQYRSVSGTVAISDEDLETLRSELSRLHKKI